MPSRPRPGTSDEVRHAFIEFFAERGHAHQPGSSLVPFNDPSVLLTTAGMQQMIPYMLGREAPPAVRMTSIQKCFRTGDIDEVGNPRNLTFFEMMGNFSIGDYFKESIIPWAWEFVTEWLQFAPERVYVTVHPSDDEARQVWLKTGFPAERISDLEENWWGPPGAEGPCGPDSELYYDWGPEVGCGSADCAPGCECDRFLEFWNLVFMQYYQDRQGNRTLLPRANVDTGSGLERVTSILQDVRTVYETDLFLPIIDATAEIAGTAFGQDEQIDYALRVVADHARGATFLAADGIVPGNEGRGYVMRRIVRRAVRYSRKLGIADAFLGRVVSRVIDRMAGSYPELDERRAGIVETIVLEEARFADTLESGSERLSESIAETLQPHIAEIFSSMNEPLLRQISDISRQMSEPFQRQAADVARQLAEPLQQHLAEAVRNMMEPANQAAADAMRKIVEPLKLSVPGLPLFQLHDTFGLPIELSQEIISELGLGIDRAGFDEAMEQQRRRSRAGARFRSAAEVLSEEGPKGAPQSFFKWDEPLTLDVDIVAVGVYQDEDRIRWDLAEIHEGQRGQILVMGQTPFYPEGGGQVGDQGILRGRDGIFRVTDTRRLDEDHILHLGQVESGRLSRTVNSTVQAEVDRGLRAGSERHHTLTHILHRTLKDVLGETTEQKGSLVAPHVARFDFNHPRGLTREQLTNLNATINRHILDKLPVRWSTMDIAEARAKGAVAIFGERYGSSVRLVDIGDWSKELCGGTHVHDSTEIGAAILVREGGLASGIRRVEVLAGDAALNHAWEQQERLIHLARSVGAPVDQLEAKLAALVEELDHARREASRLEQQLAAKSATGLVDSAVKVGEVRVLAAQVDASSRDALREMTDQLRAKLGTSVVALGASLGEQQAFVVGASRDAIERGVNAGDILRQALAAAGGKGGGRPDFAQGGVKEAGQLGVALAQVVPLVERAVGGP